MHDGLSEAIALLRNHPPVIGVAASAHREQGAHAPASALVGDDCASRIDMQVWPSRHVKQRPEELCLAEVVESSIGARKNG
jgi:hypothetical protein